MPDSRIACTVKSAVQSIIGCSMNVPNGTAKNRNSNGKRIVSATSKPSTAGTDSTSRRSKSPRTSRATAKAKTSMAPRLTGGTASIKGQTWPP